MLGQISLFDLINKPIDKTENIPELLSKGEIIYKVTLGEIDKMTVDDSFVVRDDNYRGYWLTRDDGSHDVVHDEDIGNGVFKEIDIAKKIAEKNLSNCKTIFLDNVTEYRRWEYTRETDKHLMVAEIGIIENCVYFHDWYCYRFAIPFRGEKEKEKIIKESLDKILNSFNAKNINYKEIQTDSVTNLGIRLYWSNTGKRFADYRYTKNNP